MSISTSLLTPISWKSDIVVAGAAGAVAISAAGTRLVGSPPTC